MNNMPQSQARPTSALNATSSSTSNIPRARSIPQLRRPTSRAQNQTSVPLPLGPSRIQTQGRGQARNQTQTVSRKPSIPLRSSRLQPTVPPAPTSDTCKIKDNDKMRAVGLGRKVSTTRLRSSPVPVATVVGKGRKPLPSRSMLNLRLDRNQQSTSKLIENGRSDFKESVRSSAGPAIAPIPTRGIPAVHTPSDPVPRMINPIPRQPAILNHRQAVQDVSREDGKRDDDVFYDPTRSRSGPSLPDPVNTERVFQVKALRNMVRGNTSGNRRIDFNTHKFGTPSPTKHDTPKTAIRPTPIDNLGDDVDQDTIQAPLSGQREAQRQVRPSKTISPFKVPQGQVPSPYPDADSRFNHKSITSQSNTNMESPIRQPQPQQSHTNPNPTPLLPRLISKGQIIAYDHLPMIADASFSFEGDSIDLTPISHSHSHPRPAQTDQVRIEWIEAEVALEKMTTEREEGLKREKALGDELQRRRREEIRDAIEIELERVVEYREMLKRFKELITAGHHTGQPGKEERTA